MGKTAVVLGGSGFVGRHISASLQHNGWDVTIASRGRTPIPLEVRGTRHTVVDREDTTSLRQSLRGGVDVLVDVIPYEVHDAKQVVALGDLVGSVVSISTASVYADTEGRTLDEAGSLEQFPRMPVPIPERQARADPERDTYSGKKVGIEDVLLDQTELPATVIRPCAIYGPGAKHCREWFFVKRVLDRRPRVILAYEGESVFHTTSVDNLAEIVRLAAERPGTRVLNCGDPDPPSVRRIAAAVAEVLGHDWEEVLVPGLSEQPFLENPWAVPTPWVLDMAKAQEELGYIPVKTHEEAIFGAVESIVAIVADRGAEAFSETIPYLPRPFDYEAEDAFMSHLR